jgi:hypothetical protein
MSKKISLSMIIALIVAMLTSSLALAAGTPANAVSRPGSRFGIVFSISKDSFTLKNAGGKEKTVLVGPTTRFVKINGDAKAFKDLGVGQGAIAFGTINASRELEAKVVLLATRRFNRGDWSGPRQYGNVVSVDTASDSFRVNTPSGFLTFTVDDDTHYPGRVKGLEGLKAGMTVFLGYERGKSGMLKVKALIAIP